MLGAVAPLALGAAAGTALVVDLDPHGPRYPGDASLKRLAADGPRRADLSPIRDGVAVLNNGGIDPAECPAVLEALSDGWPSVVLRLPPGGPRPEGPGVVPVHSLVPGGLFAPGRGPAVYQRCGWGVRPSGPGPVLPRPRPSTIRALLEGQMPFADRWVRSWRRVWEAAWT